MLLKLIEDYNVKLLSTKVYWEKPEEREVYKKFWTAYSKVTTSEAKEVLAVKRELYDIKEEDSEKISYLRSFYKRKLVDLGVMKSVKGKNVSFMENNAGWHGVAPKPEQCEQALEELGGE